MNAAQLRALQAPLKSSYREDPSRAQWTLKASGRLGGDTVTCRLETPHGVIVAGLHPATGGDGKDACSGDMLLEALVACAGVTLKAVATALDLPLRGGTVSAEGDLDFRGTLGVARDVPAGFTAIRLKFDLDSDASPEQLAKLIETTERYCVIYQTLRNSPSITVEPLARTAGEGGTRREASGG